MEKLYLINRIDSAIVSPKGEANKTFVVGESCKNIRIEQGVLVVSFEDEKTIQYGNTPFVTYFN